MIDPIDVIIQEHRKKFLLTEEEELKFKFYLSIVKEDFLRIFYFSKGWEISKYKGIKTYKFPTDFWILQEIVIETKPDLVIELGTMNGGMTLFYADLLEYLGNGMVISVDIEMNGNMPQHQRIKYIKGDSTSEEVINQVYKEAREKRNIMVDLDSNHKKDHVLKELNAYGKFVTIGNYLIIEDTIISGHPIQVFEGDGKTVVNPGPYEAVSEFLKYNEDFQIDKDKERFMLTTNIDGYLKRIK